MFYRFKSGQYVEADDFKTAQILAIQSIVNSERDDGTWHECKCDSSVHRYDCPRKLK